MEMNLSKKKRLRHDFLPREIVKDQYYKYKATDLELKMLTRNSQTSEMLKGKQTL